MPIQSWSEDVLVAELQDDPVLTDDMKTLIDDVQKRGDVDVVLDFSAVTYLNSSNIARLLKLRKLITETNDRKLRLCAIGSHVWSIFLITGLEKLFDFADNVALGLASIKIEES
jgi:anti-anti-sigma factor